MKAIISRDLLCTVCDWEREEPYLIVDGTDLEIELDLSDPTLLLDPNEEEIADCLNVEEQ